MNEFEIIILFFSVGFCLCSVVLSPLYYAVKNDMSYSNACKELYIIGIWGSFKRDLKGFIPMCKKVTMAVKDTIIKWYDPFCSWLEEYRRQHRQRFRWGYDFECEIRSVLKDYAYSKFEPYVNAYYGIPSVVQVQYITQKAATDEQVQECLEMLVMKFRHIMASYNLNFKFFPYFFVNGCEVNIFILYCEYDQEVSDFYKTLHTVIMTKTEGAFGTLKECNVPRNNGSDLILGYSASKWDNGGIIKPFIWQCQKDPHLACGGITGAGKSTACMLLVRQLLQRKANITILDFKGATGDWQGIFKADRYAEYLDCDALFDKWYQEYLDLIERKEYKERYLIIDEYGSFVLHKSSKEQKEFFNKLSHIAYTGRSWGARLIIINQFYSAEIMPSGVKDQFSTRLYFGNRISVQSALSLFPGAGDAINKGERLPNFSGYITTPTTDLDIIVIPELENPKQLKRDLQELGKKYY